MAARPVLSVQYGTNADLIAAIAPLYIKPDALVVDATYGKGTFWKKYRPERLVAHDLYTVDGVDFRQQPEADASVDVGVFDPPYTSTGTASKSTVPDLYNRYGLGAVKGWKALFEMNAGGLKSSPVPLHPGAYLLVTTGDYVESGKRRWGRQHAVTTCAALGLEQVDEIVHVRRRPGPQPRLNLDGTPRRQRTSRQAHTFLLIFRAPGRRRGKVGEWTP